MPEIELVASNFLNPELLIGAQKLVKTFIGSDLYYIFKIRDRVYYISEFELCVLLFLISANFSLVLRALLKKLRVK